MNIAGVITEFILERQSTVNGFVNDYTFTVKTDIPLISGDVLKFTFPDEITSNDAGSGNSQCVSTDTIKCSNTDHEFQVQLNELANPNEFKFTITNLGNPKSLRISEGFTNVRLCTEDTFLISEEEHTDADRI